VLFAATAALAVTALVPTLAAGAPVPPGATVADVTIKLNSKGLPVFTGPPTVENGDYLQVTNNTNGAVVGPHTFSLVTQGVLPKTKPARKNCFVPNHICFDIAQWHQATRGPIGKNPVEVGAPGWDTMGNLNKKGDSWFTGNKFGRAFAQQVTAAAGTRLNFLCAIHPFMKGSIDVIPATP
jgi:hypothetical protein